MNRISIFTSCPSRITWLALAISTALAAVPAAGQQTRPAPLPAGTRILHFPKDHSLGWIYIQDVGLRREIESFYHWVDGVTIEWEKIGEARGDVAIPAGQRVKLLVTPEGWKDLSPLTRLAPDDLYALTFMGTGLSAEATVERGYLPKAAVSAGDPVMPHVAHLTGLNLLDLHTTEVSGNGLRYIERMKSLECLFVPQKTNDVGMGHVARLTGLKRLYFKQNKVTNKGLARLADLRQLEELELGGENMTDAGLVHLKKLPKLQYLCLWGRGFTDAGMVHVKEISSLRTFHPVSMVLGDEGLAHLSSLTNLERLSLYGRKQVTDVGMAHVARMTGLRQLDVSGTGIGDIGGEHLQKLENLELLHLSGDFSRPVIAALLATKPGLRDLRCAGSSNSTYGDEVLEQVGKMADLESLFACGTQVTDAGLASVAKCTKLRKLTFFGCPITNQSLAEIGKLANLEELTTYRARFTTSGLKQLNGLTRLEQMRVSTVVADDGLMDISGLTGLRRLTIRDATRGPATARHRPRLLGKPQATRVVGPWPQLHRCRTGPRGRPHGSPHAQHRRPRGHRPRTGPPVGDEKPALADDQGQLHRQGFAAARAVPLPEHAAPDLPRKAQPGDLQATHAESAQPGHV
jgi:Leucine-rich repeat (LRR) protein